MGNLWGKIVVAIVTCALTMIGQQYFFEKQNEIQKLDVHINFDKNYLSKPKFPDSKVEIKVDGSTKESIGLLEISLVNFSDKVFKDIPIVIEVKPKESDKFTYLSHFAHGEKGIKNLVEETKDYEFDNGVHRFSYKVKSLNRSEGADPNMKLGILFDGQDKPQIIVSAIGLNTREYNYGHSPAQLKVERDISLMFIALIVGVFLFTYFIFGPAISRITAPLERRKDRKYAKELFEVLRGDPLYNTMSDNDLTDHITSSLYKRQVIWWNRSSWTIKLLWGMRRPKPTDFIDY
ncbi:hypothetical protein HWQ46_21715 [Shewanella sp. D64]|uniref:hypothetical protein n=1 Tax=unclassified Shewanella TaxID=196818 RepID=UPI0022BA47DE|nr:MULTISPECIES: hypothetical protein [unclassified Shewanella]MEC4728158.1 hypothetical protein [Shewanella sp. D64]MEC4740278.1 hypothetical protein [Shewanella sp. E94]WBJ94406.1 hypothetical protein HWQ47_21440 [Shewanella sp. MTB7]